MSRTTWTKKETTKRQLPKANAGRLKPLLLVTLVRSCELYGEASADARVLQAETDQRQARPLSLRLVHQQASQQS